MGKSVNVRCTICGNQKFTFIPIPENSDEEYYWEDHNGYSRPVNPLWVGDFISDYDLKAEAETIPW